MGDEERHIYKIEVDGMNKTEYYEFDIPVPEMDVKDMWINHGMEKLGLGILSIKSRVTVEKISGETIEGKTKDGRQLTGDRHS